MSTRRVFCVLSHHRAFYVFFIVRELFILFTLRLPFSCLKNKQTHTINHFLGRVVQNLVLGQPGSEAPVNNYFEK